MQYACIFELLIAREIFVSAALSMYLIAILIVREIIVSEALSMYL